MSRFVKSLVGTFFGSSNRMGQPERIREPMYVTTPIPSIAVADIQLTTLDHESVVGIPHWQSVVVVLAFVGPDCKRCAENLGTLYKFRISANRGARRFEVVIVSAHDTEDDFNALLDTIPRSGFGRDMLMVPFGSAERLTILRDFEPYLMHQGNRLKAVVLDWAVGFDDAPRWRPPRARACQAVLDPMRGIKLGLDATTSLLESEKVSGGRRSDPSDYPSVGRVEKLRLRCNPLFQELRDLLYYTSRPQLEAAVVRDSMADIFSALKSIAGYRCGATKYGQSLSSVVNAGATESSGPGYVESSQGESVIREQSVSMGEFEEAQNFIAVKLRHPGLVKLLLQASCTYLPTLVSNLEKTFEEVVKLAGPHAPPAPFPSLFKYHEQPVYVFSVMYHGRAWTIVREIFPQSANDLRVMVSLKVGADMRVARMFFGPPYVIGAAENAEKMSGRPDGGPIEDDIVIGPVRYTSVSELGVARYLQACATLATNAKSVSVVILLVVMSEHRPEDVAVPFDDSNDHETVPDIVSQMLSDMRNRDSLDIDSPILESVKEAAAAMKLIELESLQVEALKRMPVIRLHSDTLKVINREVAKRKSDDKTLGDTLPSADEASGTDTPAGDAFSDALLKSFRQSKSRGASEGSGGPDPRSGCFQEHTLSYSYILLQRLVKWFSDDFIDWVPDGTSCVSGRDRCRGRLHVRRTTTGANNWGFENTRAHLFRKSIVEHSRCSECSSGGTFNRPVYDFMQMLNNRGLGRCGEHAKLFALMARSLGFKTRIVVGRLRERFNERPERPYKLEPLDHAWNEVYINHRWVHVDTDMNRATRLGLGGFGLSSGQRFDCPLAYESEDSQAKLLMAIGVAKEFSAVVTNRYIGSIAGAIYASEQLPPSDVTNRLTQMSGVAMVAVVNKLVYRQDLLSIWISLLKEQDVSLRRKFGDQLPDPALGMPLPHDMPYIGPSDSRIFVPFPISPPAGSGLETFSTWPQLVELDQYRHWRVCAVHTLSAKPTNVLLQVMFEYCTDPSEGFISSAEAYNNYMTERSRIEGFTKSEATQDVASYRSSTDYYTANSAEPGLEVTASSGSDMGMDYSIAEVDDTWTDFKSTISRRRSDDVRTLTDMNPTWIIGASLQKGLTRNNPQFIHLVELKRRLSSVRVESELVSRYIPVGDVISFIHVNIHDGKVNLFDVNTEPIRKTEDRETREYSAVVGFYGSHALRSDYKNLDNLGISKIAFYEMTAALPPYA